MNVSIERRDDSAPDGWSDEGRSALWAYLAAHDIDPVTEMRIKVQLSAAGRYEGERVRLTMVRSAP